MAKKALTENEQREIRDKAKAELEVLESDYKILLKIKE